MVKVTDPAEVLIVAITLMYIAHLIIFARQQPTFVYSFPFYNRTKSNQ